MITMILGYLGAAGSGAILKGVFGIANSWILGNQEKEMALINAASRNEILHIEKFGEADDYTKHTRRALAFGMCFTYCAILLLWAIFPQIPIATFIEPLSDEVTGYGLKVMGWTLVGLESPTDLANRVITVTTGHLVIANSFVLTFILSAYFMPVGRK